ncbi:porin [uncultured Sutterella sp.]|uniref:porin n=1 Tax=uncultured Sutterella sp. TaxID=286133 RepID=UPI00260710E3|nr:porin [uncultured Sutterella sp.]
MKKTLAALAVLGAFAGTAAAADVTLYGVADLGLNYLHSETTGKADVDTFSMASGQNSGSRFGLKGTEDLGNGMKVGFVLENGFKADDGTLDQGGRLFGREAIVYVNGAFGTFAMGRTGALAAGTGSYNLLKYAPFSTGWSKSATRANFWLGDRDRMDNTVTYVTPSFAGFKVSAQYSFNRNGQEDSSHNGNERWNDRYAALGASYSAGNFNTALVVDTVLNAYDGKYSNSEDSLGVSWTADYNFGFVKPFVMAQYGKNENMMGFDVTSFTPDKTAIDGNEGFKGYTLGLGATAPVFGGTLYVQANYLDSESESDVTYEKVDAAGNTTGFDSAHKYEGKNYGFALGYKYPLSKRTSVYGYGSYSQLEVKNTTRQAAGDVTDKDTTKQTEFGFGLVHTF